MKTLKFFMAIMVLAAIFSSCGKDPVPVVVEPEWKAEYAVASATNGGILYDKFWAEESNFDQTNTNIPAFKAKGDFFRCKQCHGWDGLGNQGAYINRAPKANRPRVTGFNIYQYAQANEPNVIFDMLNKTAGRRAMSYDLSTYDPATNFTEGDKMPDFSKILTIHQIWDIVKFLKTGMMDVTKLYDATYTGAYPTGKAVFSNVGTDGDATAGLAYYNAGCKMCHGTDGTTIPDLDATPGMTAGKFVRKKSNEAQHKIHYGQLGSIMAGKFAITPTEMKNLYKALNDTVVFPN